AEVRVMGTLSDGALASAVAGHEGVVMPSRYEGFGMAIAEAMAHGLAVVASRAGAIPEIARDGNGAILVPPGDRRALMGALALLVRDRARLDDMQARALAW